MKNSSNRIDENYDHGNNEASQSSNNRDKLSELRTKNGFEAVSASPNVNPAKKYE